LEVNVLQSSVPFPLSSSLVQDRRKEKVNTNTAKGVSSFIIMKGV
jgi:hypothetical protein